MLNVKKSDLHQIKLKKKMNINFSMKGVNTTVKSKRRNINFSKKKEFYGLRNP